MINDKFVQIRGPFKKNEELVDRIRENYSNFHGIKKIGIQSIVSHICSLNSRDFEIGEREILEFDEVNITSIYFKQDEPSTSLIDCVLI